MALLFTDMGVASGKAVVIAISYRVLTVWLPLLIGYFFTRRLGIFRGTRILPARKKDPEHKRKIAVAADTEASSGSEASSLGPSEAPPAC